VANRFQQGCVDVVQLDERLTLDEVDSVRALLLDAVQGKLPQVVVDLRRVRLVDSAALELLCDIGAACRQRGGVMRLAGAGPLVRDVLRITGLDRRFPMHDDFASAAGAFAL
jgi:anti-anti-sigma factor